MKISIITPFCNTDIDLFRETVKSVNNMDISQDQFEWIIVFHNCTENSCKAAMELVEKTSIAVNYFELNDNNRTPSAPRNYGISKATGEYIYFLDSDDLVDAGFLNTAIEEAEESDADIVLAGAKQVVMGDEIMPLPMNLLIYSKDGVYRINNKEYLSEDDNKVTRRNREILGRLLYGAPVFLSTKIIRRSLLEGQNIRFDLKLRMMEDICFDAAAYAKADKISVLTDTISYTYVQNGLSLMQRLVEKGTFTVDVVLDPLNAIVNICEKEDIDYNLFLWSVYEMLGALSLKNVVSGNIKRELVLETEEFRKKLRMIPFTGTGRSIEADNMRIIAEAFIQTGVYEHMGINTTLQQMVEDTRRFGRNEAVCMSDECLTYDQLHKNADAIASYLCHVGIHRGDRVGIYMDKSTACFCALFGIVKAGAAFVVISGNNSKDRNKYIIENSKIEIIIDDENYREIVQKFRGKKYEATKAGADDLITIEYTSGSEGIPKGVAFTNRNFASSLMHHKGNFKNICQFERSNTYVMHMGLEFLFGLLVTFEALLFGKHLFVMKDVNEIDSEFIKKKLMDESDPVSIDAVPSVAAQWFSNPNINKIFKNCRLLVFGGEGIKAEQVAHTKRILAENSVVFHGYATTETGPCCYEKADPDDISSGTPQSDVSVSILDEDLNPVPTGEKGRICIKGYRVANGYVGKTDDTAFVCGRDGMNTFISGDMGCLDNKGRLHVCGRMDRMLKINGVRIEPAEIENAIMKNPCIDMAAYKVFDQGETSITGLFIHESTEITEPQVRGYLLEHIPRYMMPDVIVKVEKMPLTDRGKLDYAALSLPEEKRVIAAETVNHDVETVIQSYREVLRKDDVTANDNFFVLGGDSLKAVLLTESLRKRGITVTVRDIFIYPTPDGLAKIAGKECDDQHVILRTNNEDLRAESNAELELFGIVKGFYFLPEEYREAYRYTLRIQFETTQLMDEECLKKRIGSMQKRHPTLRSCFKTDSNGRALQIIGSDYPEALFVKDISYMDDERSNSFIDNFWKVMDEIENWFYVASFKVKSGNYVVLMKTNHMIADAWGNNILLKELTGKISVDVSESDGFISYQKKLVDRRKYSEEAIDYFKEYLADAQPARLETMGGIVDRGTRVISQLIRVSEECKERLVKLCTSKGVSLNSYLQYLFGRALMEVLEQDSAIFICSFSGRTDENINIVANYFTTLPVCIRRDMNLEEFQNHMLRLQEYSYLDSDSIGKALRIPFRALGCVDGINFNFFEGALDDDNIVYAQEVARFNIKGNRAYTDGKDIIIEIGYYENKETENKYERLKKCLENLIKG